MLNRARVEQNQVVGVANINNDEHGWVVEEGKVPNFFVRLYRRGIRWVKRCYLAYIKTYLNHVYETKLTAKDKDPAIAQIGAPGIWNQIAANYAITSLATSRAIIESVRKAHPDLPPSPKDAFWVLSQIHIPDWVMWLPNQVGWWLSVTFPWVAKVTPYIPFVGTVLTACQAGRKFYLEKNKNLSATLKLLADVSSTALMGVAVGLMLWGSVAAMAAIPYLLAAATIVIATVGLVRTGFHLYKAFNDPANRKQHLINATKEFLSTVIQATSVVCLCVGGQIGQQVSQFMQTSNISFIKAASALYAKLPTLTNVALVASGLLVIGEVKNKIVAVAKFLGTKSRMIRSFNTGVEKVTNVLKKPFILMNNPVNNPPKSVEDFTIERMDLITEINNAIRDLKQKKDSTPSLIKSTRAFVHKKLYEIRHPEGRLNNKIFFLQHVKQQLEDGKRTLHTDLVEFEKSILFSGGEGFFQSAPTNVYQSFFKPARTEELMKKSLKLAQEMTLAQNRI